MHDDGRCQIQSDPSRSHNSDSLFFSKLLQNYFSFLLVEIKSRDYNHVLGLRSQRTQSGIYGMS
jgi:hypothetical protein